MLSAWLIWKMSNKFIGYIRGSTRIRAIGEEVFSSLPEPAHKSDYFTSVLSTPGSEYYAPDLCTSLGLNLK